LRDYVKDGLHVNTFVVNTRWVYSQMWLLGVQTVTTETFRDLAFMQSPKWYLAEKDYLVLWITVDVFSVLMVLFQIWWKKRRNAKIDLNYFKLGNE